VLAAQAVRDASGLQIRIGSARPGGGYTVSTLPLETYIARVLTGEALPDSPPAAFEALAIAVRTYTLANRGRHAADGFDLCDETHCQVMRTATAATERAAAATAGRALLWSGGPATIYYSASCGGRTEIPSEVWPGAEDPPFLPSQLDDGCGGAPVWTTQLAPDDLLRALRASGFRGSKLKDLRVLTRNSSGRVARLRLEGMQPDEISGQDLRAAVGRTLGWQHLKSTAFDLKREADGYRFNGHGSGHGVGMCVIGATRLAGHGEDASAILRRYYPGLSIAVADAALTATGTNAARLPQPQSPAESFSSRFRAPAAARR
jgi:stage II sporulation protein D